MYLDLLTLHVVNGLVVTLCAGVFIVKSVFDRNDSAGRLWSLSYIAGITLVFTNGTTTLYPAIWWSVVATNLALTISVGALWCGARRYNERSTGAWVVAVLALVVVIATLLHGNAAGSSAGAFELWLGVAALTTLSALEALRGHLGHNLSGLILAVTLFVAALSSLTFALVFVIAGGFTSVVTSFLTSGSLLTLAVGLVAVVTVCLSVVRAERPDGRVVENRVSDTNKTSRLHSASSFAQTAADHLVRGQEAQVGLALIGVDVDNLADINRAFGRVAGDEAIAQFAQRLRAGAPVMSLISHRSSGRFFVLVDSSSAHDSRSLVERIQTSLVDEPVIEALRIRVTASFGIAHTYDHGYDLAALGRAVDSAIDSVKNQGGNNVTTATAPNPTVPQ